MCGICGEWNVGGVEGKTLTRMNAALPHRGPDGEGTAVFGEAGLAMRRLAVIDLEGGAQPMPNEDRSVWTVFNGEIYNHRALRRDLERRGHRFRTSSDTEAIVHLYEERGERVVDDLRGMFAFAIWDTRRRKLLLARDRFGQKPLFYRFDGRRLLFASEIKALLAADPSAARELDPRALDEYLTLRFIPSPRTLFEDVRKLPPAHLLVLDASGVEPRAGRLVSAPVLEVRRYWQLRYEPKRAAREAALVEEGRERVRETVEAHLVSDVPVGAFLSGGMDSSLVAALMAELARERGAPPVPTFAIGVEDASFDELPWARRVAEHCGTDHHEEIAQPDMVELLPRMVHHLDEPRTPSPPACSIRRAWPPGTSRWC
jgi:asparagine synthase (glutamine-hydrolysing)